jgi:hypothetical protein
LIADGENGADKVLVGAHASGDAVKDNSDFHKVSNFKEEKWMWIKDFN